MKIKQWNMLIMVLAMTLSGCDKKDTREEIDETDPMTEFSVTLNGEKFVLDDPDGNDSKGSNKADENWVILIPGKEEDGGPYQSDFIITFKDFQFTEGDKQVDGMILNIWKDNGGKENEGVLYGTESGKVEFKVTRIEEWKTVGTPEVGEFTYYLLDGTFAAQMTPVLPGDPVIVEDARFKNLVVMDVKTKGE